MKYFLLALSLFTVSISAQEPKMRYDYVGFGSIFVDNLTADVLVCGERSHVFRCYRIDSEAEAEFFQKGKNGIEPMKGA